MVFEVVSLKPGFTVLVHILKLYLSNPICTRTSDHRRRTWCLCLSTGIYCIEVVSLKPYMH